MYTYCYCSVLNIVFPTVCMPTYVAAILCTATKYYVAIYFSFFIHVKIVDAMLPWTVNLLIAGILYDS